MPKVVTAFFQNFYLDVPDLKFSRQNFMSAKNFQKMMKQHDNMTSLNIEHNRAILGHFVGPKIDEMQA